MQRKGQQTSINLPVSLHYLGPFMTDKQKLERGWTFVAF